MTPSSRFLRRRRKLRKYLCRAVDLAKVDTATAEFRFEVKRQARLIAEADATSDIMDWLEAVSLLDEEN
ncbi:antitoxin MazE-like protein [Acidiphilium sp. PM]|uniref:antitoxin MazE-like protein n=1 Tax=Acidiphilium sp. PM TaxID=1043206 RepID=UPI0013010AD1